MSELSTFDDDGHLDHMGFVPGGWGEVDDGDLSQWP